MTITDTDRRIAAVLGEAVGLIPNSYASPARSAYNTWAGQPTFSDQDRATLAAIFAEGLTAITTPGATPGKLEPVVNLTFDQIKQGMRRWVTEYHKDGKRSLLKTVRQIDRYEPMRGDNRPRGYVRYTDGTDEYMGPGTSFAFLADSVPDTRQMTHLAIEQIRAGMRRPLKKSPTGSRIVSSTNITNRHDRKIYTTGQSGYVYYTDGGEEYVNPGHKIAFLADSVPSEPEPTWITRHIPVPDVLPGMVTGDGTRIEDVVVRTSLATGEKTYDVQYPDFEDADLGRNETIGVRCDRISRLPLIPRT